MGWSQVVTIIAGSSVLSAGLNIWYSSYRESRQKERLYSPVRFYLMLMKNNSEVRNKLLLSRQSLDKKLNYNDPGNQRMQLFAENNTELINEWWVYAEKVLKCFEDNSQYIENKHRPILDKLFRAYILRKTVSGKEHAKNHISAYDDDVFTEEAENTFVKTFDALRESLG